MSEKNQDVVRALAAFGSADIVYHSFGPFVVRPRVSYVTSEQNSAAVERLASRAPDPISYADPLDEPAFAPLPRPILAPTPEPVRRDPPPASVRLAPRPAPLPPGREAPMAFSEPLPAIGAPEPVPMPVQMPAAPLYPLLAAALPESSEPIGHPASPQLNQAGNLATAAPYGAQSSSNNAWQGLRQPASAPAMPQTRAVDYPAPMPTGLSAVFAPQAAGAPELPADRRSLTDMFRVLSGRGEAPVPAPMAEPPPVPDAQALFRRI